MRVLLDTCVFIELTRIQGDPTVRQRVREINADALHMSVITFGELAKGMAILPAGARKRAVASWLLVLEQKYSDRVLPVDREVARIWADLTAHGQAAETPVPVTDGLIAATALRHGLQVMTRNVRHFATAGASIINPWEPN